MKRAFSSTLCMQLPSAVRQRLIARCCFLVAAILTGLTISSCGNEPVQSKRSKPDTVDVVMNVFFESSMSMDGFVRGDNEFEAAMMKLTGALDRALQPALEQPDDKMSTRRFRLREASLFTAECSAKDSVVAVKQVSEPRVNRMSRWFQEVEPTDLGNTPGRKFSELSTILKLGFQNVSKGSVNVIISDMILSPTISDEGPEVAAKDYQTRMQRILMKEQAGIENTLTPLITESKTPIAMVGCRFESRYHGQYVPEIVRCMPKKYRSKAQAGGMVVMQRPYYVWIVGDAAVVEHIANTVDFYELQMDGLTNTCQILDSRHKSRELISKVRRPSQAQIPASMRGQYAYAVDDDGKISVTRLGRGNVIGYAADVKVPVNVRHTDIAARAYPQLGRHSDSVVSIKTLSNGTLRLFVLSKFASEDGVSGSVTRLTLTCPKPSWFDQYNTDDDAATIRDKNLQRATFGLRYLMDGVWNAFHPTEATVGSFQVAFN